MKVNTKKESNLSATKEKKMVVETPMQVSDKRAIKLRIDNVVKDDESMSSIDSDESSPDRRGSHPVKLGDAVKNTNAKTTADA